MLMDKQGYDDPPLVAAAEDKVSAGNPEPGSDWSASHPAVAVGWVRDEGLLRLAVLSHPNYPFLAEAGGMDGDLHGDLRSIATAYVRRVRDSYGHGAAHDPAFNAACAGLESPDDDGFGWLDIGWGGGVAQPDPRLSFWVERRVDGEPCDRSLVLLAANRFLSGGHQSCEGHAVGLRVVMQVASTPNHPQGPVSVRVTGLSASRLRLARAPVVSTVETSQERLNLMTTALAAANAAFGFVGESARLGSMQLLPERGETLFLGTGRRNASSTEDIQAGLARVFEWSMRSEPDTAGVRRWTAGLLVEQASNIGTQALLRDPASRGPAVDEQTRRPVADEHTLEALRVPVAVETLLRDPEQPPRFEVRQSPLADLENHPEHVQVVEPGELQDLRLFSDQQSAVHAYLRAREFFDRLQAYGLDAAAYFKLARLPLLLRHRAWFFEQPDGLSINAQVRPDREAQSLDEDFVAEHDTRPQLEIRFGAAHLEHRVLRPDEHQRLRAQPLGIAADPRVAWHEFGHVLSYAATGALEFHFAHSAGDALAAIVADPGSLLATAAACRDDQGLAGYTFPWVQMPRRHDREAQLGWCWCGRRNAMRGVPFRLPAPLFKGYHEEQMLSSSLFRLYRVLGGDSFSQPDRRGAAADYSVYLVMRAIALLGPAAVVPALCAEAFAAALVDADVGTGAWEVDMPGDGINTPTTQHRSRCGGTAHKVIRWAFEQQGLYAADDPQQLAEGGGLPPPVDLYIPGQGLRLEGGYAPVDLNWQPVPPATVPAWHADDSGLRQANGEVVVSVRNRGPLMATGVKARAWAAPASVMAAEPLTWQALPPVDDTPADGNDLSFSFLATDSGGQPLLGPYYVLAEVHCDDDRANLHPDARLACSGASLLALPPALPLQVVDLVANDNNLALRRLDFA